MGFALFLSAVQFFFICYLYTSLSSQLNEIKEDLDSIQFPRKVNHWQSDREDYLGGKR